MTKQEVYDYVKETNRMIDEIRERQIYIENNCPHDWIYCNDPSGGSDSGYYCPLCGATK